MVIHSKIKIKDRTFREGKLNTKQFIFRADQNARLTDFDPRTNLEAGEEKKAKERLEEDSQEIAKYQDMLMAHEKYGLLILFQGMDGAGKDSAIKHVMSSLDPQGCEMKMFKSPTEKELKHGYMLRAQSSAPARGQIAIFNRSYYEHVIVERIHAEKLERQNLPKELLSKDIWEKRFGHINSFEQYLFDNGIHTLKFYLNISKEVQGEKLLERIERPDKKWKFTYDDVEERELWNKYMKAYDEAFKATSTKIAPWYIIPDDHRWYARAAIASTILEKLRSFHSKYPTIDKDQKKEMDKAKAKLRKRNEK